MKRIQASALLLASAAVLLTACASTANASTTPFAKVRGDMAHLKKAENAYSKAHGGKAKPESLLAKKTAHVGKYTITTRAMEEIGVDPGRVGNKLGYCASLYYSPYHHAGNHFAYYDSILKVTHYNVTSFTAGGACYSLAQQQKDVLSKMRQDAAGVVDAEQDYVEAHPGSYGITFTATYNHITTLPGGDQVASGYAGQTLHGYANPTRKGFCVVVTNKLATSPQHSYYYASTTNQGDGLDPHLLPGGYGTPTTGSCAAPLK